MRISAIFLVFLSTTLFAENQLRGNERLLSESSETDDQSAEKWYFGWSMAQAISGAIALGFWGSYETKKPSIVGSGCAKAGTMFFSAATLGCFNLAKYIVVGDALKSVDEGEKTNPGYVTMATTLALNTLATAVGVFGAPLVYFLKGDAGPGKKIFMGTVAAVTALAWVDSLAYWIGVGHL